MDAIRGRALFQAIDEESLVKIDFHVGEKIPGELRRSTHREIFPGVSAPVGVAGRCDPVQADLDPVGQPQGPARREGDAEAR